MVEYHSATKLPPATAWVPRRTQGNKLAPEGHTPPENLDRRPFQQSGSETKGWCLGSGEGETGFVL